MAIAMHSQDNLKSRPQIFDNQILKVPDVALILGFSKDHIYRLVGQKKLPCYKKGKTLFFMGREIREWIEKGAA
jgi:excisionase family DNA binding protein